MGGNILGCYCGNQYIWCQRLWLGESLFSVIKVVAIAGFCILGVILAAGGGEQGYIGGRNWHLHSSTGFMVFVILWLTWLSVIPN